MPADVPLLPGSLSPSPSEYPAPPCLSLPLTVHLCLTENFPRELQCLNITVLSTDKCKEAYPGQIDATMFCAGDQAGRDSCQVRTEAAPTAWGHTLSAENLARIHSARTHVPYNTNSA